MMGNYLRNLHAQFFDDPSGKKIKVYFETHMDSEWSLIDKKVPAPGSVITDNLDLAFNINESASANTFKITRHEYIFEVDIPAGFKHFTSVILYHSQGSDHDSVGTAGDPT